MREWPLLFNDRMVQAILDGSKQQARLVVKPSNSTVNGKNVTEKSLAWTGLAWGDRVCVDKSFQSPFWLYLHVPWVSPTEGDDGRVFRVRCRYEIGDRLFIVQSSDAHRGIPFGQRYWSRVYKYASCWEWFGHTDGKRYGQIWFNGKRQTTHRVAWQLVHGKIPEGKHILHTCDVPWCVNPTHLYLGDNQDNINDKVVRGRLTKICKQDNHAAKLNAQEVEVIKELSKTGLNQYQIASRFKINQSEVSRIVNGKRMEAATEICPEIIGHRMLEVVGVRVQRLQDITEADAIAEGCSAGKPCPTWWQGYREWTLNIGGEEKTELMHQQIQGDTPPKWMIEPHRMLDRPDLVRTARDDYRALWDSLNFKRGNGWTENPWCWVLSFKRAEEQK